MQSIAYIRGSAGAANASVATVQNVRAPLATTIIVNTVSGIPAKFYASMGTPHTFTDPVTGETITVISEASAVDFAGSVSGGNLNIDAIAPGYTDAGSKVGDIIVIRPVTEWANNIYNILAAEHNDTGKHGNITVDSVLVNTTNQDLSNQYLYANAIINGGCMVAQRVTAPNISTSYQYGAVDRFAAKATGTLVSAGTINRITSSLLAATKGYDLQIAGLTVTGTGIAFLRYRIEAKDALAFVNAIASFGCRVYHNVGSAVNYTVFIRKANAADNFSAVTDIANSGAVSVPNTTATWLKFENINAGSLGDVSNGIEIEIQIACGAVTTKNFNFAEFTFNKGAKAGAYSPRSYWHELTACQRYYRHSYPEGVAPGSADGYSQQGCQLISTTTGDMMGCVPFNPVMRTSPTLTIYAIDAITGSGSTGQVRDNTVGGLKAVSVIHPDANLAPGIAGITGVGLTAGHAYGFNYTANAEL